MAFEYLRRKMKAIIWAVTILFVGSIFFIAGGSLCIKQQTEDAIRKERENQLREPEPKPVRGKDELDPTLKTVVARIRYAGKESSITEGELNERLNIATKQSPMLKGITPKQLKGLFGPSQLEELINFRLAELAAEAAAIDVSDELEEARRQLTDRDFARRLAMNGIDKDQFIAERGRVARVRRIIDQVTGGQKVPETRAKEYYELNKKEKFTEPGKDPKPFEAVRKQIEAILRSEVTEKAIEEYHSRHKDRWRLPDRVKTVHLMIDPAAERHAKDASVSPSEIATYYKENQSHFLGESRVALKHIFLDPQSEAYRKQVAPKDEDLKKYYEANKSDWEQPEQIWVSRILVKVTMEMKPEDDKKAEDRAKQLREQLVRGASFENVARESSEDKKTSAKGGDLGPIQAGQMSPPFDKVAFATKEGQFSEVFRDEEGFQIVKVTKREAKRIKPFAEVATDVTKRYVEEKAKSLCEDEAKRLARELAAIKDFENVAKSKSMAPSKDKGGDLGILLLGENKGNKTVDEVGSFGYMDEAIQKAVQGMAEGKVSEVVKSAKGYHILKLEKKLPAEPKPLDDVKNDIQETLKARHLEESVRRVAKDATVRLKAGEPFVNIVKDLTDSKNKTGLSPEIVLDTDEKQAPNQALVDDVGADGKLPQQVIQALEALQLNEVSEPISIGKKTFFLHVMQSLQPRYKSIDDKIRKEIRFALNPDVTPAEMEKYFQDHKEEFQRKPGMSADWVVFPERETADEALAKIKENPKAFDEFPNKKSYQGEIRNPALRDLLSKLKPGETSPTVQEARSLGGFVVARLNKQEAATEVALPKVEREVRERVLREKKEELYRQWLAELKTQAKISKTPLAPSGL